MWIGSRKLWCRSRMFPMSLDCMKISFLTNGGTLVNKRKLLREYSEQFSSCWAGFSCKIISCLLNKSLLCCIFLTHFHEASDQPSLIISKISSVSDYFDTFPIKKKKYCDPYRICILPILHNTVNYHLNLQRTNFRWH